MRYKNIPILLLLLSSMSFCQAPDTPGFKEQMAKAREYFRSRPVSEAIHEYKKASKMAHDTSFEALFGLARLYRIVGAHKDCVESALKSASVGQNDSERADAHWIAGNCMGAQQDAKKYPDAEREFRTALQLAPDKDDIRVSLGTILMKQGRDAEGVAEMKAYLEEHPEGRVSKTAQAFAENPRRAREVFIPDFSITTLDGRFISTDDFAGKVVVIDFWATWCAPCRSAVGELRSLAKKYADKPVVLLSVSGDRDRVSWQKFIDEQKMQWPQYYDEVGQIRRLFGITALPSYLVFDGEGIMRKKIVGAGGFQLSFVEDEIKRDLKKLDQAQKPQPGK
jgi:thiol-disulfide isomerase/thioredoxin